MMYLSKVIMLLCIDILLKMPGGVVKNIKNSFFCLIVVSFSLFMSACKTEDTPLVWDGQWERTIYVPEGFQGRCVNEFLTITGKTWYLTAIVHSTFECNQPFLELSYEGSLQEVQIKKETDDKDVRFQIYDIHLAGMVDVAGDDRAVLSESAVENLSAKYVPEEFQFFEQKSYLSHGDTIMRADIFQPVINFAIPGYPVSTRQLQYKRVK